MNFSGPGRAPWERHWIPGANQVRRGGAYGPGSAYKCRSKGPEVGKTSL